MPLAIAYILTLGLLLTTHSVAADNPPIDPALSTALAVRSAEDKRRDAYRHPAETLTFFRIKPDMTVAEGLPGGGWYTQVLANYLGAKGTLYGVTYASRMWRMFDFATPDWIDKRVEATSQFPERVASYTDNGITARGFTFEQVPENIKGTVDRVLLIRALHNLNRFEHGAETRTEALASVHSMLKGKPAGKNPWKANTLEWTTDSPPPHGNWPELPNCYRGPYEYSVPGREEDYWPQDVPPDTAPAE